LVTSPTHQAADPADVQRATIAAAMKERASTRESTYPVAVLSSGWFWISLTLVVIVVLWVLFWPPFAHT
jgi:hypothetical protein